jgi:hypothetical protein
MKQKLSDIATLLKTERKYQIILALVVLAITYLMFANPQPPSGRNRRVQHAQPANEKETMRLAEHESYVDLTKSLQTEMQVMNTRIADAQKGVEKVQKRQEDNERVQAEILRKIIEKINDASSGGGGGASAAGPVDVTSANSYDLSSGTDNPAGPEGQGAGAGPGGSTEAGLMPFGDNNAPQVAPPLPKGPRKLAVIGAGDSVRVKLLAGVNAPTDGTPYPVVFSLDGDVMGPDNSTLPLGEARLIAAAQGSLTDQRALFRLTSLNIRMPSGRRKVLDVDGWVVGEDGLRGMEGVLLDPIGRAIGAGLLTGGLQGLGDAVASKNITRSTNVLGGNSIEVSGSEVEYAAGVALSKAADKWSSIIQNRVNMMVPHVQVLSGRVGTAVFAKTVKIPDLYDELGEETDVYSSMD